MGQQLEVSNGVKKKIAIIGAGGHSNVVIDILKKYPEYEIVGYLDDDVKLQNKKINNLPILGKISDLKNLFQKKKIERVIIGIGNVDMKARRTVFEKLIEMGIELVNAIHPTAIISDNCKIGRGVLISAGTIINPGTVIGDNVVIYTGSIIEHNTILKNHVYISPGVILSGTVTIKENTFIGSGAVVIPKITIGKNVLIGAGAVVVEDIPDNVVAVGLPAKPIKQNKNF